MQGKNMRLSRIHKKLYMQSAACAVFFVLSASNIFTDGRRITLILECTSKEESCFGLQCVHIGN
jgi:hypothetical protein